MSFISDRSHTSRPSSPPITLSACLLCLAAPPVFLPRPPLGLKQDCEVGNHRASKFFLSPDCQERGCDQFFLLDSGAHTTRRRLPSIDAITQCIRRVRNAVSALWWSPRVHGASQPSAIAVRGSHRDSASHLLDPCGDLQHLFASKGSTHQGRIQTHSSVIPWSADAGWSHCSMIFNTTGLGQNTLHR